VRRFIVELLLRAEKKRDALKRARGYVKAAPESAALMRALMAALHANEKEKEYLRLMERLYKLDEDDPGVNNDLGYCWADRGVNLAEAEGMIRKALAAKPGEVAFKDSLGWVFYKQAKFAAAERIFDRAVQADEAELHPIILDHAGDTCWRLGRTDKAVRLWRRAVRLAQKVKSKDREVRQVLTETPAKIRAAESGGRPKVAPLGKGVAEPAGP
jgi:tetratricopeptide (TPR) repeat protein